MNKEIVSRCGSSESLRISRILHAGYVFECGESRIAFDPIFENPFSKNCFGFPEVQFDRERIRQLKFDAVFISHYHDDHCSLESLNLLDRATTIYIYCLFRELLDWVRELGFVRVVPLVIDAPVIVGSFEVIPRRALDAEVDSIFEINASGLRVLNVVDSWIDQVVLDRLSQKAPWDLILWPFQTMRELEVLQPSRGQPAPGKLPPEWIPQLQALNPRYIVPSSCQFRQESWSWYNQALFPISYRQFQQEIGTILPKAEVIRMDPASTFLLNLESLQRAPPLTWVQPIGDHEVDYDYRPDLAIPSTAEIARQFAPISQEQTEKVIQYCLEGLLERYRSLDEPCDPYFAKPLVWRLSLYDHVGRPLHFHYLLHREQIQRVNDKQEPFGWLTEVPLSRLHSALEYGESLTSLYLRVNDFVFENEIEAKLQDADILEDPLIRCLFTGIFGAYQKAQLQRLCAMKREFV